MEKKQRYLVTTALPYANGPIHIGHLAGVYVPADIYVRFLRQKGIDVKFIGGSDEHGVPITIKAREEGVTAQDIVDRYHKIIKKSFEDFGISFDIYSRTSNKNHHETSAEFFKKLYDKNEFTEKTTKQYYDKEAKQFLADRYIKGTCPHCSNADAFGDQCEKCGTSLSPTDLINPKSTISGGELELKETKHWFLPLDKHEAFLRKWILEEHKEWRPNVYGACKSWLDRGLHPRAVSRDLNWGVPVPVEGAEGKVLYVWFDAPIGYISATKELTRDWEKYWKDEDTKIVHFIGKDNIVFHCIIFPAMLKAEGSFCLPDNVPSNEFLNLENNKISTSRNWAVWLHEYLEDFKDKQDVLRYVLTANAPETKDNNFTWKDFQRRNNTELVAILGNFVNRALVLTQKYFEGKVTEFVNPSEYDKSVLEEIPKIKKKIEESLANYRFKEALSETMSLARLGNKYLADTEPWKLIKTDKDKVKPILYASLQITAALSVIIEPFLPFTASKLQNFLNIEKIAWDAVNGKELISAGHNINKPKLLFAQITDEQIEKQLERLEKIKEENDKKNAECNINPAKENISFDDFTKLDIRTATIISAEKMPKTKKLLKLTIDTGIDKRTVVSAIAEYFKAEEIVGKQVPVLVNLAPRKIRGVESQGMILMGEDTDGKLTFISPEQKIFNGAEIR